MVKKAYSLETKLAYSEMKKAGKSNEVIMDRDPRYQKCKSDQDLMAMVSE